MGLITYIQDFLLFINFTVVPFIIALAFLFFIWNAFRFFIVGGRTEDGRANAKKLMLYGISAFVIIIGIWAIVNILVFTFGFGNNYSLQSDYINGGSGSGSGSYNIGSYTCNDLIGGFQWCGQSSGSQQTYTPGAPAPTINPNPPPTTNTISFP